MITIDHKSKKPLYQQVYEQIRDQILDGSYQVGTKLPPIRRLADDLEVSRNTVEAAYMQLSQEGYVVSRTGSGFVVEAIELVSDSSRTRQQEALSSFSKRLHQTSIWPVKATGDDSPARGNIPARGGGFELDDPADRPDRPAGHAGPADGDKDPAQIGRHNQDNAAADSRAKAVAIDFDFTYGNLQSGSFPAQLWRKLTNEVLFSEDAYKASIYTDNLGEHRLREQIAKTIHIYSGVNCHPAQVVVQAGTQASLYNLLALFDPLRDTIAMENPGYDGARSVFENARFRLFPTPTHASSKAFIDSLYSSHARLAYVTPSNQFPTGRTLQLNARQQLLKWASSENAFIIEDDYCREFRYNSRPLPSLQSLDRDGRVIYMGTFSKALSPALRMNYLVLPPDLLFEWHKLFVNHYPEVPWLPQAVLTLYMERGYWDKHLRRAQSQNKRKYQLLVSALQNYMGDRVDVMERGSGLHLLVGVLDGRDQSELISLAQASGVKVYDTRRYWMGSGHPMQNYVLIGFSAIPEQSIEPGIRRLAEAWFY
jgi:GntR family transcriptional regulator/MocR family aminotransferase